MSTILKYWLKGWLVMLCYILFSLILAIVFVPVNLIFCKFSIYENTYLVAALNLIIWIGIAPFAFYLTGSFTGIFIGPQTPEKKPIKLIDPNTGVVTELDQQEK